MSEVKELAIGEEGVIDGVRVRCVRDAVDDFSPCMKCILNEKDGCADDISECRTFVRKDGESVHFEEAK